MYVLCQQRTICCTKKPLTFVCDFFFVEDEKLFLQFLTDTKKKKHPYMCILTGYYVKLGVRLLNKQSTISKGWLGTVMGYHLPSVGYCAKDLK